MTDSFSTAGRRQLFLHFARNSFRAVGWRAISHLLDLDGSTLFGAKFRKGLTAAVRPMRAWRSATHSAADMLDGSVVCPFEEEARRRGGLEFIQLPAPTDEVEAYVLEIFLREIRAKMPSVAIKIKGDS